MKRMLLPMIACLVAVSSFAAGNAAKHPMQEPYQPTKLEWLAMELHAYREMNPASGGREVYTSSEPNTIIATYFHDPQARAADVQIHADAMKKRVNGWVDHYGYTGMVKVDVIATTSPP